jgi:hypothetical protein
VKGLVADSVTTKQLCIDDVCMNRDQLKELMDRNRIAAPQPTPISTPEITETPAPTPEITMTPTPEVTETPAPEATLEVVPTSNE